jgi:membrane associated rhomboid family serine protease
VKVFQGANPFDQLTPAVKGILIANVAMYLLSFVLAGPIKLYLALTPVLVVTKFWIWQVITYAFIPPNGWQLFFNMFALWMFAPHIETHWGTKYFLRYYLLCALGAALGQFILAPEAQVMGASGAIYGLLVAFGFLFPDSVIYLFFVFPVRAIQAVMFIALLTLVSAFGGEGGYLAQISHLGGMLTGFLLFKVPEWSERSRLWRADRQFRNPRGGGRRRKGPITEFEVHDPHAEMAAEVDRILDKINTSGVESLSSSERETMKKYGERKK